ncbi:hypothetical protein [Cobetia marina]|uniref:hypothetical protein n=1 Tax=Cobetia marina TaxID=28258 RepID=UPI001142C8AA|nr:hypothetical protein [Cobetia marina]GED41233.1 hypothetical protein HHA02_05620 [Cobetia marina]
MADRKTLPYQDVKLPVNDPLMPLSQINALHGGYAQMMHDSYIAHRAAAVERQRMDIDPPHRLKVARVAREQAILTIVLAGMTLESAVNAMGAHYFPGNRFRNATQRYSLRDTWQIMLQNAFGRAFREDSVVYKGMETLAQNRNALVHNRAQQMALMDGAQLEEAFKANRPGRLEEQARQAFEAVVTVSYAAHAMTPDPVERPVLLQSYDLGQVPYLEEEFPADIWAEIVAVRESMSDAKY